MKKIFSLSFYLLAATTNIFAQDCSNPIAISICPGDVFQTNDISATADDISIWKYKDNFGTPQTYNAAAVYPTKVFREVYFDITIAGTAPQYISFTSDFSTYPIAVAQLKNTFDCSQAADSLEIKKMGFLENTFCPEPIEFPINSAGTYRFVIEAYEFDNMRFSIGGAASTTGCQQGTFVGDMRPTTVPIPDLCPFTPYTTAQPHYEICLNGTVIPTDSKLTYDLLNPNQLCIKNYFKNLTGGGGLHKATFYFGPALAATPTNRTCGAATLLAATDLLPLINKSSPPAASGWKFTTSNIVGLPTLPASYALLQLTSSISYEVINSSNDATNACPIGNCQLAEFCFEVIATSNLPELTKTVASFTPNFSEVLNVGCFIENCPGTPNFPTPPSLYIDFEDPIILDLDFLSFKAEKKENKNILDWTMTNQNELANMLVQRSKDAINWETLAEIPSNSRKIYQYTDLAPHIGDNYYRIEAVSTQAHKSYSKIQQLKNNKQNQASSVNLFPNPTNSELNISFSQNPENVEIELFTIDGRKINIAFQNQSSNLLVLNMNQLPKGVYILKVQQAQDCQFHKIIKE